MVMTMKIHLESIGSMLWLKVRFYGGLWECSVVSLGSVKVGNS